VQDEPRVDVFPTGIPSERPDGPPTAVVSHRGLRLELRFARGDFYGEGLVQELRVLPGDLELEPKALRHFAPSAEVYLAYARSTMQLFGTTAEEARSEEAAQARIQRSRDAALALATVAGPGRRHTPAFYRAIANTFEALVAEGEPHPIKTIAEMHHVGISAASKWVSEARRRGYLTERGDA
jgi:hypothetical protein